MRRRRAAGAVTTIAGGPKVASSLDAVDGTGALASFFGLGALAADASGTLFALDHSAVPRGVVSTIAGGPPGHVDGEGEDARFSVPGQVAVDGAGQVYVSDLMNTCIRVIKRAP